MRTLASRLALSLSIVFLTRVAICQENGSPGGSPGKHPLAEYIQEFFLSDTVRCQEKGEWQLTAGMDFRKHLANGSLLKTEYGVTDRLQLGVELPYGLTEEETNETRSRLSTASLALEYQIIRSDWPFALSAGIAVGIPVRSSGEVEYEPTLLVAKSFRKLQIHASFAAEIEEEKPYFQYNLSSVYPVQRRWFTTFEFNGRSSHEFYLTPGLYRHVRYHFEIGAGVPLGVGGRAARLGIVGKVNWELGGARQHETEPSKD